MARDVARALRRLVTSEDSRRRSRFRRRRGRARVRLHRGGGSAAPGGTRTTSPPNLVAAEDEPDATRRDRRRRDESAALVSGDAFSSRRSTSGDALTSAMASATMSGLLSAIASVAGGGARFAARSRGTRGTPASIARGSRRRRSRVRGDASSRAHWRHDIVPALDFESRRVTPPRSRSLATRIRQLVVVVGVARAGATEHADASASPDVFIPPSRPREAFEHRDAVGSNPADAHRCAAVTLTVVALIASGRCASAKTHESRAARRMPKGSRGARSPRFAVVIRLGARRVVFFAHVQGGEARIDDVF